MFNTVTRVAGIAVVGGVALFAGYSLWEGRPSSSGDEPAAETVAEANGTDTQGFGGTPEGTSPLSFEEGQDGEAVRPAEDDGDPVVADAPLPPEDETEAERIARLGEGGLLDDDERPDLPTDGEAQRAPDVRSGGLRGLPVPQDPTVSVAEAEDGAEPARETVAAVSEVSKTEAAADEPASTTEVATDESGPSSEDAQTAVADADVPMERNPLRQDKPDSAQSFAANTKQTDKPDDGKFFTANSEKIDKPDDGDFFTDRQTASSLDPCIKADGTRYTGPGTVTNPFDTSNPCLPQATDSSLAEAPLPPAIIPEEESTPPRRPPLFGQPFEEEFFGPRPTAGEQFSSDYRSL